MISKDKKCTGCRTTIEHNAEFYKKELEEAKRILGVVDKGMDLCEAINPHLCSGNAMTVSIEPELRNAIKKVVR